MQAVGSVEVALAISHETEVKVNNKGVWESHSS